MWPKGGAATPRAIIVDSKLFEPRSSCSLIGSQNVGLPQRSTEGLFDPLDLLVRPQTPARSPNDLQFEARIVTPATESAAAGKTGGETPQGASSRKNAATIRTRINETTSLTPDRKWQLVTAILIANPQIGACPSPFRAVRQNTPPARACLREQMCQFVAESPIDFCVAVCGQPAVQPNASISVFGATGRGTQARRPLDDDLFGENGGTVRPQENPSHLFQFWIATWPFRRDERGEQKLELFCGKNAHLKSNDGALSWLQLAGPPISLRNTLDCRNRLFNSRRGGFPA